MRQGYAPYALAPCSGPVLVRLTIPEYAMEFKPDTFFIGVIDFFSVILPGAVITFIADKSNLKSLIVNPTIFSQTSDVERWGVFLVTSYIIGHFLFLLGSKLDNLVYDRIRQGVSGASTLPSTARRKASGPISRRLGTFFFSANADLALEQVLRLRDRSVPGDHDHAVINAFQWSKAKLTLQAPAALAEVQRLEADSKFFRSMVVVLLVVPFVVLLAPGRIMSPGYEWLIFVISPLLMGSSMLRYIELRFKATQYAYWYLLTLMGGVRPTHAGGIVYWSKECMVRYLLVRPRNPVPDDGHASGGGWVFPKGHINDGEETGVAALREVREETGIVARLIRPVGTVEFKTATEEVISTYYLMERECKTTPSEAREKGWFTLAEALILLQHDENRRLLAEADRQREQLQTKDPTRANNVTGRVQ
jgi:ADP-ribose pyrophosphatase YjhB (NUDIX family)